MRDVAAVPLGDLRTTQLQPAIHPSSEETRARLEQDHRLVGYMIARFGNWLFEPLFYYGMTVVNSGADSGDCIEFWATLKDKETVRIEVNGGVERYCIERVDRRLRLVTESRLLRLPSETSPASADSAVRGFVSETRELLDLPNLKSADGPTASQHLAALSEDQIMPFLALRSIRWFFDQYWQQKAIA